MARNVNTAIEIQPEYPAEVEIQPEYQQESQYEYVVDVKIGLNLREKPGGSILAVLAHGSEATMISEAGEWMNVITTNGCGWVMSKYLERKK